MKTRDEPIRRSQTEDSETVFTESLHKHVNRHVLPPKPVTQRKLDFEHKRSRLMRECLAEATGVFFYVFPGIAAIASFTVNAESPLPLPFYGNILQVGFGFALGIALAIITCAPVSGGHFNPAITICLAYWQGFPWRKVPHYIISQIFGSFIAGMIVIGCYWPQIQLLRDKNIADMGTAVFNGGAASIFCAFPNPNQTNQGFLFFLEFFVDFFIGIALWACLDPANPFMTPAAVPLTVGLTYASMIWGFAVNTISTNTARDLGARIVAGLFFGSEAFTFNHGYPWIALLVNLPATFLATAYYEFLIRDSLSNISQGHAHHEDGVDGLRNHLKNVEGTDVGYSSSIQSKGSDRRYGVV